MMRNNAKGGITYQQYMLIENRYHIKNARFINCGA